MLGGLYEAIADETKFGALLAAMDDFIDANPDNLETGQADWKEMFRHHFRRAGLFLETAPNDHYETPIAFVDKQVVPAAVIDRCLDVHAANELFANLVDQDFASLSETFTTPADAQRLAALFKTNTEAAPVLISLTLPHLDTPLFVVAAQAPAMNLPDASGPFVKLKVARATWNANLAPLLEAAYGCTLAEIEVLEGLVETGSVASVAIRRKRSVRTVRTQLTHIFGKLGLTSQTELALFLATLSQLMTKQKRPSDISINWLSSTSESVTSCSLEVGKNTISYIKYGDPDGQPVLMIHSTTPPEMTPMFRRACREAGLFMIGVHKPGSGGASPRPACEGPDEMAQDYAAVLDYEGINTAVIAGHCSGGLYALTFAKQFGARCVGLVLIDTGVPFKGRLDLMKLPKPLRRTFLPARYIPEVLLVPHRIFAANFKRSGAGEARVVDYFFEADPEDQHLTRTDRVYYEITRQIIAYSFEDIDRLVHDVQRWARDWIHLLVGVVANHPVTFMHGDCNHLFSSRRIARFCDVHKNANLLVNQGMGQLQVYQAPKSFALAARQVMDAARAQKVHN